MARKNRKNSPDYKGNMTAAELGALSSGGQRTKELIEKGKQLEEMQREEVEFKVKPRRRVA
jgi:hypothetical protein